MADPGGKIRLYVASPLAEGRPVPLREDQAHYLFTVMRQTTGARISVFNGRDGEWLAEVTTAGRRGGELTARALTRPQRQPPDLWLLFAPIKKARTDFIIEKATELGVARICPVFTRFTNAERLRPDRLLAHAIEAAEQCGETHVPALDPAARLEAVLDGWPPERRLMFCDETGAAPPAPQVLAAEPGGRGGAAPWAILIGPEGGFAPEEARRLNGLSFVRPVGLGPRILRADTAAVAAVTVWHSVLGDWA